MDSDGEALLGRGRCLSGGGSNRRFFVGAEEAEAGGGQLAPPVPPHRVGGCAHVKHSAGAGAAQADWPAAGAAQGRRAPGRDHALRLPRNGQRSVAARLRGLLRPPQPHRRMGLRAPHQGVRAEERRRGQAKVNVRAGPVRAPVLQVHQRGLQGGELLLN